MKKSNKFFKDLQKAFNTGVSFMLPAVVVGGIFLAISLATGEATESGLEVTNPFMKNLNDLGDAGFAMMIPLLSGYIANTLAGKPALAPAMVLGYIANNPIGEGEVQTGFLGAMIMGVAVGYFVRWCKTWKVPSTIRTIMPILIVPVITTFVLGMIYIYVIAVPIGAAMDWLVRALGQMQGGSAIIFGLIIGAMTAVDMGGPVNKTVTAFTLALMAEGVYAPNGAHRIAVAIPPLALAISTFIDRKKYTSEDKDLGISAFFMGLIGITEGAIPFAVKDIKRVLPAIIIGSAVGGAIGMANGVEALVPHGGLIILPVVNGKLWYFLSMLIGTLVSVAILHFTKPNLENIEK
ncbi:PTS fructose transporter subunit IIC [Tetragenococcus koreensis]|uniref:PTS fructose transporter subunit IIC n=1 Tax=Tetragenococcus koreensis TaxID=290335 RepID=UPI001F1FA320|nr:PTS fructose transporter subunit IIC [Tetragenococcus koreensis]MDN6292476.1 PTS fructose transporter subunit IIC [Tetragenococcus halophilus]MDN6640477.1 PTS fructose transporter subunit IIC [Tetragenococcus sp.]MCF1585179.1 PTS fructose transporter subunit IIC [Tetragenococcus koreensis]MCF1614750.1 PTS fructose transporter subunit IIC [Tetragenococcus koreensis]MCF1618841.1 PTS fructose transporter subunit IIC [Tetragenococcus koreensis]